MNHTLARRRVRPARFSLLALVGHYHGIWRQRQALSRLDDYALRDLGLSREDVHRESRRVFWDAPSNWTK